MKKIINQIVFIIICLILIFFIIYGVNEFYYNPPSKPPYVPPEKTCKFLTKYIDEVGKDCEPQTIERCSDAQISKFEFEWLNSVEDRVKFDGDTIVCVYHFKNPSDEYITYRIQCRSQNQAYSSEKEEFELMPGETIKRTLTAVNTHQRALMVHNSVWKKDCVTEDMPPKCGPIRTIQKPYQVKYCGTAEEWANKHYESLGLVDS